MSPSVHTDYVSSSVKVLRTAEVLHQRNAPIHKDVFCILSPLWLGGSFKNVSLGAILLYSYNPETKHNTDEVNVRLLEASQS
ncbi:hypothetical protein AOLI_G00043150 [Acnodon oligacanthus]